MQRIQLVEGNVVMNRIWKTVDRSSSVTMTHVLCQGQKGYCLQFSELVSQCYGEFVMHIERRRKDCYGLNNIVLFE